MPIIAAFFGMLIRVYHSDHEPPHIHVQYGEFNAIVEIATGDIMKGRLPKRLQRVLIEWLRERRGEIMRAWDDAMMHRIPKKIRPLE